MMFGEYVLSEKVCESKRCPHCNRDCGITEVMSCSTKWQFFVICKGCSSVFGRGIDERGREVLVKLHRGYLPKSVRSIVRTE